MGIVLYQNVSWVLKVGRTIRTACCKCNENTFGFMMQQIYRDGDWELPQLGVWWWNNHTKWRQVQRELTDGWDGERYSRMN